MNQKIDGFGQVADSMRNLCSLVITGSGELICLQLDCADEFFKRNQNQMRAALNRMGGSPEATQWPDTMRRGVEEANAVMRENFVSAIDLQMKAFKLTQRISTDMQCMLSEALAK